ncbi:MAG: hypothetical protein IT317_12340 [Anaerolineales bacterium]|nr:hypothetical protein [Anaerolineales bacterium]
MIESVPERLPLPNRLITLLAIAGLVLTGLYVAGPVFWIPTAGFRLYNSDWRVNFVDDSVAGRGTIQLGDHLLRIGALTHEQFQASRSDVPFWGAQPGDTVSVVRLRSGEVQTIEWVMPPVIPSELMYRLLLDTPAVLFATSAVLIQLLLRPRTYVWLLLLGLCYLMAVWLVLGTASGTGFGGASLGLHAVTWPLAAVILDLHLTLPRSLWGRRQALGRRVVYGLALAAAGLESLRVLPMWAYQVGLLGVVLGAIAPPLIHLRRSEAADVRRTAGLMLTGIGLAFGPGLLLMFVPNLLQQPDSPPMTTYLSLFALPLLPLLYIYALYKRYLGNLEFRANRVLTFYLFFLTLFVGLLAATAAVEGFVPPAIQGSLPTVVLLSGLAASAAVTFGFRPFQRLVERYLLGAPAAPTHLLVAHAGWIATCHDEAALVRLLRAEVLPGLLVRQSALLAQDSDGQWRVIYAQALPEGELAHPALIAPGLLAAAGRYRSPGANEPHGWVRLALPLRAVAQPTGVWLLGRRDPDDYFAASELPVLQALADHLAMALVNIHQTQLLRALYQANVNRTEGERLRLARELHDGPLNEFGLLAQKVVGEQITPDFRPTYTAAVARLRHTIAGLRPVTLSYGLAAGLSSLVSELAEQWPGGPEVTLEAEGDGCRYPDEVETHAYRIVQQACQNALRHAQARAIRLTGALTPERLELVVEDDGQGFAVGPDLTEWLEHHHYGLASMHERAALIGGALQVDSTPGRGTRLRLVWPTATAEQN